jgi:Ca-activated chloride channel homolog
MRRSVLKLCLFTIILFLFAGDALAQNETPEVTTIEIAQVDNSNYPEVTLYVRALDADGQRISGLTQESFTVREDGTAVEITAFDAYNEGSIVTMMVIDISGSMSGDKLAGAKDAALTFVDLMREQDQAGLIVFDDIVTLRRSLTTNKNALKESIRDLYTQGGTAWYDAVVETVEQLDSIPGRKSVILLSDGLDNESRHSFNQALDAAIDADMPVYTIGLGESGRYDAYELNRMAQETGGEFYPSPSADELEELYTNLSRTTQDEYVITYRSPRPTYDGTRRDILVSVGGQSGSGEYVEEHLLNIASDPLAGVLLLLPLLGALIVPVSAQALMRRRETKSQPAVHHPPQPVISSLAVAQPSQTVQCMHCGQPLPSGARFCASCGKSQEIAPTPPVVTGTPSASFCRYCGSALRLGTKFCARCGKQVD